MTLGVNDYPWRDDVPDSHGDDEGAYVRECVSFVNWRMRNDFGITHDNWGNASGFPSGARSIGLTVDNVADAYSILCIPPNTNGVGQYGHVAYVLSIDLDGKANVEDYNWYGTHDYLQHQLPFDGCSFIRLPRPSPPQPPTVRIQDTMTVTAQRTDPAGAFDSFDVAPDGTAWHTVIVPHGNPGIAANDALPGRWVQLLHAEWENPGDTNTGNLTVIGRGTDGSTYYCYWDRSTATWKGPNKQP